MADKTPKVSQKETVYVNPWFSVEARTGENFDQPYYVLCTSDYVTVVPITEAGDVVFVRQFRPAVEGYTIELPSGHVDPGERPEEAVRRELMEETGYEALSLTALGALHPDTGRMTNRLWSFVAVVRKVAEPEPGIGLTYLPSKRLLSEVAAQTLVHALDLAVLAKAAVSGHLVVA